MIDGWGVFNELLKKLFSLRERGRMIQTTDVGWYHTVQ